MTKKVTELPAATTPLAGADILLVVQGGVSKQAPVSGLPSTGSGGGAVETVAISGGSLNLSGISAGVDTVKVTLNQNVTSITFPSGTAGVRKDLLILFTQDATGGRTVTGWPGGTWTTNPSIDSTALSTTTVALMNVDNGGWKGLPGNDLRAQIKVSAVIEKSSGGTWQLSTSFRSFGVASVAVQGSGTSAVVRCTLSSSLNAFNFMSGLVGTSAVSNTLKVSSRWDGDSTTPATYVELVFGNGSAQVDPATGSVPNSTFYQVLGN